jgi:hypothetical protein
MEENYENNFKTFECFDKRTKYKYNWCNKFQQHLEGITNGFTDPLIYHIISNTKAGASLKDRVRKHINSFTLLFNFISTFRNL